MAVEEIEKILIAEFKCDKLTANLVTNKILDELDRICYRE
jgi:hypothetical protein